MSVVQWYAWAALWSGMLCFTRLRPVGIAASLVLVLVIVGTIGCERVTDRAGHAVFGKDVPILCK